ncbi:MAG: hypothetical protein KKA31_01970, partial [Candidatus Margulisbacteria bacterium]|nr:hypothetical protein [Candidatus Margulisiibacteriota bacterium]
MTFFSNKAEKEEPALSSVNLIIDKEEYPVYRGNEWFNALNRDCGEFIEQGNLREEGLNQCLRGPRGSAFHLYLKSLKMATVVLGEKELKRHAEIIEMMEASEPLELEAESTAFENDNVMILSSYGDYPNYADYYCKVYGFPIPTLPESLRNIDKMVGLDLYNVTTTLPADTDPVLYRLVSKDGISYIPLDPNSIDISIEMKRVPGALGLAR